MVRRFFVSCFVIFVSSCSGGVDDISLSETPSPNGENQDGKGKDDDLVANPSASPSPVSPSPQVPTPVKLIEFSFDNKTVVKDGLTYTANERPKWQWKINRGIEGPTTVRFRLDNPILSKETPVTVNHYVPSADLTPGNHSLYLQILSEEKIWSEIFEQRIYILPISDVATLFDNSVVVPDRIFPRFEKAGAFVWPKDDFIVKIECKAETPYTRQPYRDCTELFNREDLYHDGRGDPSSYHEMLAGVRVTDFFGRSFDRGYRIHISNGNLQFMLPRYSSTRNVNANVNWSHGAQTVSVCLNSSPSIDSCNWVPITDNVQIEIPYTIPDTVAEGGTQSVYLMYRDSKGVVATDANKNLYYVSREIGFDTMPPSAPTNLISRSHPTSNKPYSSSVFNLDFAKGVDTSNVNHECALVDATITDLASIPANVSYTLVYGNSCAFVLGQQPDQNKIAKTALVRSVDETGKVSAPAFYPFLQDNQAPTSLFRLIDPDSGTIIGWGVNNEFYYGSDLDRGKDITFFKPELRGSVLEISVREQGTDVSEICFSLDSNLCSSWQSAKQNLRYHYQLEPGKELTFYVFLRDETGNTSKNWGHFVYAGPLMPIRLTSSTHPNSWDSYKNRDPQFSWSESAEIVEGYECSLSMDSRYPSWTPCSGNNSQNYNNLTDGRYYFQVRTKNLSGQYSTPAILTFGIDNTPPNVTVTIPGDMVVNGNTYISKNTNLVQMNFSSNEKIVELCVQVDSGECDWTSHWNPPVFSVSPSEVITTVNYAKFKDAVGNIATVPIGKVLYRKSILPPDLHFDGTAVIVDRRVQITSDKSSSFVTGAKYSFKKYEKPTLYTVDEVRAATVLPSITLNPPPSFCEKVKGISYTASVTPRSDMVEISSNKSVGSTSGTYGEAYYTATFFIDVTDVLGFKSTYKSTTTHTLIGCPSINNVSQSTFTVYVNGTYYGSRPVTWPYFHFNMQFVK